MKRAVFAIAVVAGCRKTPPSPVVDPPAPAPAVAVVPDASLARTPLTGALAGQPFAVARALLRVTPTAEAELELYSWRAEVADPCDVQVAMEPVQRYVKVSLANPAVGKVPAKFAIYSRPEKTPIVETTELVFDELGDTAKGRLRLTAPDGTRVEGTFEALVCDGRLRTDGAPAPIHGLAWGTGGIEPANLPKAPAVASLRGELGPPVVIEVIDWKDIAEQHELHFYFAPPKRPCQFTQIDPGFVIGFGTRIARGVAVNAASPRVVRGSQPWGSVVWRSSPSGFTDRTDGWVTAIIDKHTKDTVEGRVFAWFHDPSKSMIAGAFVAKNCNAKP